VLPMLDPGHDLPLGSGVASQLVGDKHTRGSTLLLEELAEQAFGGLLVAPALDENIENEAAASTSRLLRARARGSVAGGNRRRQPGPEMEVSSHCTRRWREMDSNHRSRSKGTGHPGFHGATRCTALPTPAGAGERDACVGTRESVESVAAFFTFTSRRCGG
jgi:hypothetical protein